MKEKQFKVMSPQEKELFSSIYWCQDVCCIGKDSIEEVTGEVMFAIRSGYGHLQLNPLSSITDEDALEVYRLLHLGVDEVNQRSFFQGYEPKNDNEWRQRRLNHIHSIVKRYDRGFMGWLTLPVVDYLRSRGYFLPWKDFTCEDILANGVVKLEGGEYGVD